MASQEHIPTQEFPETPENRKDPEGVDMTEAQERLGLPHGNDNTSAHAEPSGAEIKPTGEEKSAQEVENEFNAVEQGAPEIGIEGVTAERTEQGWSYFFNVPPEARGLDEFREPRIHLGNYSGGGAEELSQIKQQAHELHGKLASALAERRNAEREGNDDNSGIYIAEGHNINPNPIDHPDAYSRHKEGYQQMDHDQSVNETKPEPPKWMQDAQEVNHTNDKAESEVREARDEDKHPEDIPLEAAGMTEYAPREMTEAELEAQEEASPSIPQEARDTPHDPLDPQNPPGHVLGTNNIPPGELIPEIQRIPGQPSGPELEP